MPILGLSGLSGLSMFESRFNTQIYAHFGGRLYILALLCTQRARQDRPTDSRSYNTYCIIIYVYGFPCGRGPSSPEATPFCLRSRPYRHLQVLLCLRLRLRLRLFNMAVVDVWWRLLHEAQLVPSSSSYSLSLLLTI